MRTLKSWLGVDGDREATLVLCAVGRTDQAPPHFREAPRVDHATQPLSSAEVSFADIPRMHAASGLRNGAEAAAWRAYPLRRSPVVEAGLISPAPHESTQMTTEQVIPGAAFDASL